MKTPSLVLEGSAKRFRFRPLGRRLGTGPKLKQSRQVTSGRLTFARQRGKFAPSGGRTAEVTIREMEGVERLEAISVLSDGKLLLMSDDGNRSTKKPGHYAVVDRQHLDFRS